jgi:rare lipoprotein A
MLIWAVGCAPPRAPAPIPGHPKPYRVGKTWYQPVPDAKGFRERGVASWYGSDFHGRKTSSGEVYDMYAMTAAHKTLPLGTYVRVRNLTNSKVIDVRVNDRGPFVEGRIIDLSYTGAKALGIVGPGTAPVEIMALGMAAGISDGKQTYVKMDYEKGAFTIQVGAFLERANAERLKAELDETYKNAHIVSYFDGRNNFYRVRVGRCTTLGQAVEYEQILKDRGYETAMIVAE